MKFLACKKIGGLGAANQAGEDALRKLKIGDVVTVEVKKLRNGKHHRMYWALLGMVFENQTRYETVELLHTALKLSAGIYTILVMPNGAECKVPGSIGFDEMDQLQFSDFYDRVCDLLAEHFLPGVTSDELKREVSSMIGLAA